MANNLTIHNDLTITVHGVDYGNGGKPLILWAINRKYLAMKIPSGSHWADRMNGYVSHPGRIEIFAIEEVRKESGDMWDRYYVKATEVLDMPVSIKGAGKNRDVELTKTLSNIAESNERKVDG